MIQGNPEAIALWVAGLRSGNYIQGRNVLARRESDGSYTYCCLGVACEVAIASGLPLRVKPYRSPYGPSGSWVKRYDGSGELLPPSVTKWLNLTGVVFLTPTITATTANDREGWTFAEIADVLETRYLKKGKK